MIRMALSLAGILVAGSWLVVAAAGEAAPRIGYLTLSPMLDPPSPERAGFLLGLREHGYKDGKNIIIEYRSAEGDPEALPFLAEDLVERGVRLVVTVGQPAIQSVQQASKTVPVVMMFGADPVTGGLVKSLARPGGNITGMSQLNNELGAKRLELLKEAIPTIRRVAVLWDSSLPMMVPEWEATRDAARRFGIRLISVDGAGEPNFEKAFAQIAKARPDALVTIADLRTAGYREIIAEFALQQRLPTMFGFAGFVRAGGLMSYAPDFADLSRRSASYVDKILRGAKPAELPIQQPTHFGLVINLKTARVLGLRLPERVLQRADELIQ